MTNDRYVAVEHGAKGAGAIVWWKISGPTMVAALSATWADMGLNEDLLMSPPTPGDALRRALAIHARTTKAGKQLVSSTGVENHYVVVLETPNATQDDVDHETIAKASVDKQDGLTVSGAYRITDVLRADYVANLTTFNGEQISQWLSGTLLPAINAVSLRVGGGLWFVPATHLEQWRTMVGVIQAVSAHVVFSIPALSTEREAIAGILDALSTEADQAAQKMEDELINQDLGPKALQNRMARLELVTLKVQSYEEMLGTSMETLRARLDHLNAQMAAAILTAQMSDDEENAA